MEAQLFSIRLFSIGGHVVHTAQRIRNTDVRWVLASVLAGLTRLQHLVAGKCLGTVMLSQTESWAEESDSSADEGEDAFLRGVRVTYRPPRLCRIVSAARVTSFEHFDESQSRSPSFCDGRGGGGSSDALQADWVNVSRCWSAAGQQAGMTSRHDVHMWVPTTINI